MACPRLVLHASGNNLKIIKEMKLKLDLLLMTIYILLKQKMTNHSFNRACIRKNGLLFLSCLIVRFLSFCKFFFGKSGLCNQYITSIRALLTHNFNHFSKWDTLNESGQAYAFLVQNLTIFQ